MFFFLPVRSESRVRRFPIVTVSLIVLNVFVFLFSYPAMKRQNNIMTEKALKLQEVEIRTLSPEDPSAILEYAKDPETIREKIKNKEITISDDLWAEWKKAYDELQKVIDESLVMKYGFVSNNMDIATLMTYIFLHAGFLHLIGNLWFLWLVGVNVEDDWGRPFFIGFYLVSGVFSALLFAAITHSGAPLIGASGAIAGVMGAFAIQYYKSKIYFLFVSLVPFIFKIFPLYAWFYLPLWFITQLFYAIYLGDYSNVAFWAHIGGFGFGVFVVFVLRFSGLERRYLKPLVEETLNLMDSDFSKAVEARSAGNTEVAEKYLKEILQKDSSNLNASEELTDIYIKGGKKKEAASLARDTFRLLRMGKKEPSIILNFYERVLEERGLVSILSPYDFYFISQLYQKKEKHKEASKVLAIAYKENRETNDAPYILLRLIRTLALSESEKFLKEALRELQKKFPEMKSKAIAILREVKDRKRTGA
jgi:membrane associated rhomboid family serine protease